MSDLYTYDYSNPKYDEQRNQWYWEGRRSDTGKKVRKYDRIEGQGQATQYETNQYAQAGYQYASQHATGSIEAGMQAMNLHQQPVDPYGTIVPNYTTLQTGAQTQDRNHLLLLREQPILIYKIERTMPIRGSLRLQERATEQEVILTSRDPTRVKAGLLQCQIPPSSHPFYKAVTAEAMSMMAIMGRLTMDNITDDPQEHSVLQQGLVMGKVLHLFRAAGLDIPPSKEAPTPWVDPVTTMMKKHFGLGLKPAVTYMTMEVLEKCLPEEALSTK
ncbi:hypothetical protein VPNG_02236 [Cytospora leucostoma]|uniref:Uncharacterized protein n=1 Tax=Cytospora leucostoma TaxID=1230097 RepID=A0A423XHJ3_9PEZI|nr:hypothetical protein VPNG_02236 [Cytospora leucostoma]